MYFFVHATFILIYPSTKKKVQYSARLVPPLSHLTSCNPIKSNLYFTAYRNCEGGRGSFKLWKKKHKTLL